MKENISMRTDSSQACRQAKACFVV